MRQQLGNIFLQFHSRLSCVCCDFFLDSKEAHLYIIP